MIKVLQLGRQNFREFYVLPEIVEWNYEENSEKEFDITFLDRNVNWKEAKKLYRIIKAYTLYITFTGKMNEATKWLCNSRKAKTISKDVLQCFLDNEIENYFSKPYGEKYRPNDLSISNGFKGSVNWQGFTQVSLTGEYGSNLSQIIYWRSNIPIFSNQSIEFWLEYEKEESVEIALKITQIQSGSVSSIQNEWFFSEKELDDIVYIQNKGLQGNLFISLLAKGRGTLKIRGLHDRYSRKGHGNFLPGGKRLVSSKREEAFFFFEPGDLKPPLNIYFSGYKTQSGFEGYNMMRRLGSPFLLISEARLEGGSFYMGDNEYENIICSEIQSVINELGFKNSQVNISGLSMGTFGALYYGTRLCPHALILGKPLASIGNVAQNERINRPGGFPTSLDVMYKLYGNLDSTSVAELNKRFWDLFDKADWSHTKFIVSYMIEDDYDSDAYQTLIEHCVQTGTQIFGKGIHGRHNDNTYGIVAWFIQQFKNVLKDDFGRKGDDERE